MGGRGSGKKAATKPNAQASKSLPAQGTGGKKRTPQSAFDGAAGKDVYEPEKIVAQRLAKGVTQYQVMWVGWESKHNTFFGRPIAEPIENLAGCEDMIAEMKERKQQLDAELEAAAEAKKAEQQAALAVVVWLLSGC